MNLFLHEPRRCGASRRLPLRPWRHLALALSLWGTVGMIPAFSMAIRAAGLQTVALGDAGEGESESPLEEPDTDAEPFGVVPMRLRLARDLPIVATCRARLPADVSLRHGARCAGERQASFRCCGNAVQLSLRC